MVSRLRGLVRAIEDNDEARIEEAILRLSRSRRVLAPLALGASGLVLLFDGVRLLVTNWRLTVVQALPAMWIWLAMFDLKVHVLHGRSFNVLRGPVLIPLVLLVAAITAAAFFLNAAFAFAVAGGGRPVIRPAMAEAWRHRTPILAWGFVVGLLLGGATLIVTRWGRPWFSIALGIVVGLMMVAYISVPARLIGVRPRQSRRQKVTTTLAAGALGATVTAPPYLLGRLGILMLGSHALRIPGIFVVAIGITLQAGATGAVRAIKMSAALVAGGPSSPSGSPPPAGAASSPTDRPLRSPSPVTPAAGGRHRDGAAARRSGQVPAQGSEPGEG